MPIINPIYFYLMEVGDGLKTIFAIVSTFSFLGTIIAFIIWWLSTEDRSIDRVVALKVLKRLILCSVILSAFATLIPSSNTVIKMVVAQHITAENYEFAKDEMVELIDYIIEKINSKEE